ncbi:MAG: MBL fold metallo-hydrolase RNA specificity domain-containing protein, partial [Solirubrobacterales bacterium]
GWQEELKLMLNLTKPRYVMPVHGDYKRLRLHSELAEAVGIERERIFQGRNGLPLELDGNGAGFGEDIHAGVIYVDGVNIGEPDDAALRDRREISADGIFIVVATVSSDDGSIVADPEVILRGVAFIDQADAVVEDLKDLVEDVLDEAADHGNRESHLIEEDLHAAIGKLVWQRLRRRPMVLPVVIEV